MATIKGDITQHCNQRHDRNRHRTGDNPHLCTDRTCRHRTFRTDVVLNGDVVDDRQNGVNHMTRTAKNGQCTGHKRRDN